MAVGSDELGILLPVNGVRLSAVESGIRYADRTDLVLIEIAEGSEVAGVFTQNYFCAAPVLVAKEHLQVANSRYFLINTGNANAGTGKQGMADALECCLAVAEQADVSVSEVLPFSTGVIGERLPVDKIVASVPNAYQSLANEAWEQAARGILTTDTRPKAISISLVLKGKEVTISGIAKGSGMVKPDMATMLAFVFTDAALETELLDQLLVRHVGQSFNRITVDGDTSTNDCCMLAATGKSGVHIDADDKESYAAFDTALGNVFTELAKGLIKDAEGATKFIEITVEGGVDSKECIDVAYTIAESPLVKTALFASDPNWGRILAAVGRAGIAELDINLISIELGDVRIVENGSLADGYSEEAGQQEMNKEEINILVNLSRGDAMETVWTSDLSHEYVRINSDYRS